MRPCLSKGLSDLSKQKGTHDLTTFSVKIFHPCLVVNSILFWVLAPETVSWLVIIMKQAMNSCFSAFVAKSHNITKTVVLFLVLHFVWGHLGFRGGIKANHKINILYVDSWPYIYLYNPLDFNSTVDTLQWSFFHAHANKWIIIQVVIPKSWHVKVCCIHQSRCQSWIFKPKFSIWKRVFFRWSSEKKYGLLHFQQISIDTFFINSFIGIV